MCLNQRKKKGFVQGNADEDVGKMIMNQGISWGLSQHFQTVPGISMDFIRKGINIKDMVEPGSDAAKSSKISPAKFLVEPAQTQDLTTKNRDDDPKQCEFCMG
jgi:hypothetical protein